MYAGRHSTRNAHGTWDEDNLRLIAQAKRAALSDSLEGEKALLILIVDCSAIKATGVLEIGERHVFAPKPALSFLAARRHCNLRVRVRQRSWLTREHIEKLELSESKIGELSFCPPYKGHGSESSFPGGLEAEVFVSNELFDRFAKVFQAGRKATQVYLEIEKPGVLQYGWEPDGSRMIWKLESATEPSYVNVTGIEVRLDLF